MASINKFDELNILGRRSMPYEQFFGEMDISEEEKQKRIAMAQYFEAVFRQYFFDYGQGYRDESTIERALRENFIYYAMLFVTANATTAYIEDHARRLAEDVIRSTKEHAEEDEFWLSDDRAMLLAENQANTIGNYDELLVALQSGYTVKRWDTMKDLKVRVTHKDVDGITIPIDEAFQVGNSELMFPGDTSLGADASEISNCRCHVTYF